ncbi:MAG: Zn-ribbon domain-containing OB-fold protein [Ilumatobacteraceae bacterium]
MKLHHDFPFPDPADQLTSGFWSAADRLELAIPRCARCLRWVWYPEAVCPTCAEPDPAWTATSGRASLFTWTEVHRALLPEYADWCLTSLRSSRSRRIRRFAWSRGWSVHVRLT